MTLRSQPFFRKLKWQTVLVNYVLLAFVLVGANYFAKSLFMKKAGQADTEIASTLITSVKEYMKEDVKGLESFTRDWAAWDDTAIYIKDRNKAYEKGNLNFQAFKTNNISMLLFFREDGTLVAAEGYDQKDETHLPYLNEIAKELAALGWNRHDNVESVKSGFWNTRYGMFTAVSLPVTNSQYFGPINGALIALRPMNENTVKRISLVYKTSAAIFRADEVLPADVPKGILTRTEALPVTAPNGNIVVWSHLDGIDGKPAAVIRLENPAEITPRIYQALSNFILLTGIIIALIAILFSLIVVRTMYRRLDDLVEFAAKAGHDLTSRADESGSDEVATVAHEMNRMMENINRDIENRLRMEKAIIETQQRYKSIFEGARDALLVLDEETEQIIDANPAAEKLYGADRTKLITLRKEDLCPPASECRESENGTYYTALHKTIFSDRTPVEVSEDILASGGRTVRFMLVRDITERVRAKMQLEKAHDFYLDILSGFPAPIWRSDETGKIDWVNATYTRFTGLPVKDHCGQGWKQYVHAEDVSKVEAARTAAFEKCEPCRCEYRIKGADGAWILMLETARPFLRSDGSFAGYIGLLVDVTNQRAMEAQLRSHQEFIQRIVDTSPNLLFVKHADGRFIKVNKAFAALYGRSVESIEGHSNAELMPSQEEAALHDRTERAIMASGELFNQEETVTAADGRILVFQTVKAPIMLPNGETGILGVAADITARKHMEAALRESEEKYRSLMENAADANFLFRANGTAIEVNSAACRLLGMNKQELLATSAGTISQELGAAISALSTGRAQSHCSLEAVLRRKDNFSLRASIAAAKVVVDGADAVLISARDMTERIKAEEALAERSAMMRALLDSIEDMVYLKDRTGAFIEANRAFENFIRKSRQEIIGKTDFDIFADPELARQLLAVDRHAMDTGRPQRIEETLPAGEDARIFETVKTPFNSMDGIARGIVGVSRDITERVQQQSELVKAKREAEEANAAKTRFLANMSHELRTPINGILGFTELAKDFASEHAQKEYLAQISASADHLLRLVNDLLDLTKVEADRLMLEMREFELKKTMETAVSFLSPHAQEKGLTIALNIGPEVPKWLVGDDFRLRQTLTNLVGNAVKFTENGGVTVSVRALEGAELPKIALEFRVTDTGVGLSKDKLDILFRPFVQGDTSTTRKYGGTGLGLYITKRIVELMGGEISVESQPGKGSTFIFTAVFEQMEEPAPNTPVAAAPKIPEKVSNPAYRGLPALVVDDNSVSRKLAAIIVAKMGFAVEEAVDGNAAIACMRGKKYALVLMDVQMPEKDGLDVTKEWRQVEAESGGGHVPIVGLTALALKTDRQKCLDAGMDEYLTKPVKQQDLEAAIGKLINKA